MTMQLIRMGVREFREDLAVGDRKFRTINCTVSGNPAPPLLAEHGNSEEEVVRELKGRRGRGRGRS